MKAVLPAVLEGNLLIDRHGEDAVIGAALMIDAMTEKGDEAGAIVWRQIRLAIATLTAGPKGPLN